MSSIKIFIGYDTQEVVAFHVLSHSIIKHASQPVSIIPVARHQLKDSFSRTRNPLESTEFSFSRFLVPHLSNYEGWAIFMDCDMLFRSDIAKLWKLRDENYAVQVVQHEHCPKEETKFLGATQTRYEKKNWSSVMLFNNAKCTALTPDFVNTASGLELHQFKWLENDRNIGALPQKWNHLVDYHAYDPDAANVHFTAGGPYFEEYKNCDYAAEWFAARDEMLFCKTK
ncbi:MAG: glycosyltransferase [Alphaproteobacteria bacterium]